MRASKIGLNALALLFLFQLGAPALRASQLPIGEPPLEQLNAAQLAEKIEAEIHQYAPPFRLSKNEELPSPLALHCLMKLESLKKNLTDRARQDLLELRAGFFEYIAVRQKISRRLRYLHSRILDHKGEGDSAPDHLLYSLQILDLQLIKNYIELEALNLGDDGLFDLARSLGEKYEALERQDVSDADPGVREQKKEILMRAFVLPSLLSQSGAEPVRYGSGGLGFAVISALGGGSIGLLSGAGASLAHSLSSNQDLFYTALRAMGMGAAGGVTGIAGGIAVAFFALREPKDFREYQAKAAKLDRFGMPWNPFEKKVSCAQLLASFLAVKK